jgi:hypothetical protein
VVDPTDRATAPAAHATASPEERAQAICALTAPDPSTSAVLASPDIVEISGLAVSRTQPGVIWAHNDSGDIARVFAISPAGEHLRTFTLAGAAATDWEDMAIGPGPTPGSDYLYLGDIGDNQAVRSNITVYRVSEPAVSTSSMPSDELTAVEAITLRYPDKPHDAETLLVDPVTGDLFIVTKEIVAGVSSVFRAAAPVTAGPEIVTEKVAEFDLRENKSGVVVPPDASPLANVGWVPTGGDILSDGSLIAIRTYSTVWVWSRGEDETVAEAIASPPCEGPSIVEPQGEAIAFGGNDRYYTLSEGAGPALHEFQPR